MTEAKIYGYTDPRTGEYQDVCGKTEAEVLDAIGYVMAWKFYWDGPVTDFEGGGQQAHYEREDWLTSERRQIWLDALTTDQREALTESIPPEEVPAIQGEPNG